MRTDLKKPRSTADLFMITESSWLYPVYEAMATMELIPEKVSVRLTQTTSARLSAGEVKTQTQHKLTWFQVSFDTHLKDPIHCLVFYTSSTRQLSV